MVITPVLLAGGSGTRLWPVSRKSFPKQFVPLVGEDTLFQASAKRLSGDRYAAPLVMTNADFRFIVGEQLGKIGIIPAGILIEPAGRNTAPAILAAALTVAQKDPEGLLLVAPSDHVVPDTEAFGRAVDLGVPAALAGRIVTFGITPTRPETGYGYMEAEGVGEGPVTLKRFVEKPDLANAEAMIAQGNFLWNAGIFLFSARTLIAAFEQHAPEFLTPVRAALTEAKRDLVSCVLPQNRGSVCPICRSTMRCWKRPTTCRSCASAAIGRTLAAGTRSGVNRRAMSLPNAGR
ncbi:mannose-1-phosphate guanylyltransferase/mannose-6-phosphate isomerase [Paracoccus laeviglucosivorans]|uniref:Mannose-1-phosphate guanylyltransferase/mannose-6-phosphate isomerase n=1 Tax=Paracoccus laeviglucosivorans TaxID=1197861 RepID=A0A521BQJ8_9RHOB|nr:mannose-1-phosphate guanylyltransferase/mannose-6-phosphate isomerase [Paracoccus laeviglucosivorans]